MNDTVIVRTTTVFVVPIVLAFAVHLLIGGHNAPGGGFVAGLLSAATLALIALADVRWRETVMRMRAIGLCCAGVALACGTGVVPLVFGSAFLTHAHAVVSTTLVFDVGVCATVCGAVIAVIQVLSDREEGA